MVARLLLVTMALLTVSFAVPTASAADVCVVGGADNCIVRTVTCVRAPCPPCVLKFCPDVRDPRDVCVLGSDGDCLIPIYCFTDPCPRFP